MFAFRFRADVLQKGIPQSEGAARDRAPVPPSPACSSGHGRFAYNTEGVFTPDHFPSLVIVGLTNLRLQVANNFDAVPDYRWGGWCCLLLRLPDVPFVTLFSVAPNFVKLQLLELGHRLRALFHYKDWHHPMKPGGAGTTGVGLHGVAEQSAWAQCGWEVARPRGQPRRGLGGESTGGY